MRRALRAQWRPTLVRRVFLSLLLSFMLVDAALLAVDFVEYKRAMSDHAGLQQLVGVLAPSLEDLSERDAGLVAGSTLAQWNALRRTAGVLPGELQLQLRRRGGGVVVATKAFRGVVLRAPTVRMAVFRVGDQPYWIAQLDAGPWRIAMGEPAVTDSWMLGWLLSDLTGRVLLAFPLVLVPLWVTVRRGFRPLRDLARQLEQRDGADLSPLALDMRYAELQPVELVFTLKRQGELEKKGIPGKFDTAHLQAIHRYLFQDVFPWAGELRVVNISKGNSNFGPAMHIGSALKELFERLAEEKLLTGLDPATFVQRAAFYLGEINAIHPFREGNGRTQREFIRQLGLHAGHPLSWSLVGTGFTQQRMIDASILSHTRGDNSQLAAIIEAALFSTRASKSTSE